MIQTDGHVRDRIRDVIHRIKVRVDERIVGCVRKRCSRIDRLGQRTLATDRDLVIGKRRALQRARLCGIGVVENLLDACAVDQSAEIAVSHGHRRDRDQFVGSLAVGEPLVGEKEEGFIPAVIKLGDNDGPAHGCSELVADQVRRGEVGWILPRFGYTEIVISGGFERRAMDIVSSRLGGKDHGGRRGELRAGVERLEFGFLHSIRVGQNGLPIVFAAEVAIGHGRPVLRIFHSLRHGSVCALAARFETRHSVLGKSQHSASILWELVDSVGVELRADRAAVVGRKLNRFSRHRDLLRDVAHR